MLSKIQGCFCDVLISWGICIYSSCISLDFQAFYIESKQEITKTNICRGEWSLFYFNMFITVFNLAFLFWGEFLSLIQIFQVTEITQLLVKETKIQRWKWNLKRFVCDSVWVCVSVKVHVCVCICDTIRVLLTKYWLVYSNW